MLMKLTYNNLIR